MYSFESCVMINQNFREIKGRFLYYNVYIKNCENKKKILRVRIMYILRFQFFAQIWCFSLDL